MIRETVHNIEKLYTNALQNCKVFVSFFAFWVAGAFLLLGFVFLPGVAFAQQQSPATYTFVSMGTPLSEAFDQFIEQSGINVAFEIDLVDGKKAFCRAVELPVEDVIVCLLKNTGLDFIRLSSGTYVLVEKAKVEAQWGEITGRVVDVESGEPLPNAHVLLADAGVGDVTNGAGRFAFANLKPGPHRVVVSYLGYQDVADTVEVVLEENALVELGLTVQPLISSPIVINGLVQRRSAESLGRVDGDVSELVNGSVNQDVIKSLNTIIGVRVGDVMADVHVQGGDAGEHQYRLDGAPVFIPIPNGGVVGPFSPFALEKFTIHKAGFSVSKGSHLSGVIEAEHRLSPLSTNTFDLQVDPL
ncbi:MAG: carboxypeptidase regulatory-like domain-containing protein, partial [Rhodothermales bacterium]